MAAGAGFGQTNAVPSGTMAPKEIGFLTRVEGLRSGLDELYDRLESFTARVAGDPRETSGGPAPKPPGLHGELSTAEDRLRSCLQLLGKLNDAF